MDKKQTLEAIAVMQAHTLGKSIQRGKHGIYITFEDCPCPEWDWDVYEYRVKPESPAYADRQQLLARIRQHEQEYSELSDAHTITKQHLSDLREEIRRLVN